MIRLSLRCRGRDEILQSPAWSGPRSPRRLMYVRTRAYFFARCFFSGGLNPSIGMLNAVDVGAVPGFPQPPATNIGSYASNVS